MALAGPWTGSAAALQASATADRADAGSPPADAYLKAGWTTEEGLPQNTVVDLLQASDGYLWVATFGGLVRFDGVQFAPVPIAGPDGMPRTRMLSLYEDAEGSVWVGTEFGGVARVRDGQVDLFGESAGLPAGHIVSIAGAADGGVWLATNNGLARLEDGEVVEHVTIAQGLPVDETLCALEAEDGTLWVGTLGGLVRRSGPDLEIYTTADGLPDDRVTMLEPDGSGGLWIGTWRGLARWRDGRISQVAPAAPGTAAPVRDAATDAGGALWVATGNGLYRMAAGETVRFTEDDALADDDVRAVLVDREGTLWLGTATSGLNRWTRRRVEVFGPEQGLAGSSVLPIYEDRDGAMWIGTFCGGLTRLTPDGRIRTYTSDDGLGEACISAIVQTRDGTLWVGTTDGLARLEDDRFVLLDETDGLLPSARVLSLLEARDGTLWLGTAGGVNTLRNGQFQFLGPQDGLAGETVSYIHQDREGALWFSTVGGLSRYDAGRFTSYTVDDGLPHNIVRGIHEEEDGSLWIGTYGGGLARLREGRLSSCTSQNGLFDDVVSRILVDEAGWFWMTGNKGIFRAHRDELAACADGTRERITTISYRVADGMVVSETNGAGQPAGWRARDGRLWFPTVHGAAIIDPRRLSRTPPPVAIERVTIDDRAVAVEGPMELPAGTRSLRIDFTGLSLAAPRKMQFRYRLEGYDDHWLRAAGLRTASYGALPPGPYRFHVQASNHEGVWNREGASLVLRQAPRFTQTWTFLALCGIGLLAAGAGAVRARTAWLVRRTRALEAAVTVRTDELRDERNKLAAAHTQLERAHADLIATLSRLRLGVILADQAGLVTFISRPAQELMAIGPDEANGRPWGEVLALEPADRDRLAAMVGAPAHHRTRVLARIRSAEGDTYWTEIDVTDDPRHPDRRIFILYDVSAVYDFTETGDGQTPLHGIVGQSPPMQVLFKQMRDLALVDATVLIEGPTGTGKELVARGIHAASRRSGQAFIPVNCAELTESLIASQLFGHRRGAFTGAVADQVGLFEAAQGGTLFLDEIGDVPLAVQTSLLRVIQEREITRVGESRPRPIDVRLIAATHRDLAQLVAEGRFREDLLYRVRVARLRLLPLRERREDIPVMVAWFLDQARSATGTAAREVARDAMQALLDYPWPGNVRELRSAVESAAIAARGPVIRLDDLPAEVRAAAPLPAEPPGSSAERQQLLDALTRTGGNRAAAARLLGIARSTFYRRLEIHEIDARE